MTIDNILQPWNDFYTTALYTGPRVQRPWIKTEESAREPMKKVISPSYIFTVYANHLFEKWQRNILTSSTLEGFTSA